jgi:signal transduction histidine kinase
LLAYPLWSWRRLEAALQFFDRELARATGSAPVAPASSGDLVAERITALRTAADQVRAAQRLVAETLEALPEAVFVTRSEGRVELANPRARALAGAATLDAVRGRALPELLRGLTPHEVPTWQALLDRAAQARTTVVTEARSAEGDYLVRCVPLDDTEALLGDRGGFVVALADVTRLKTAERQRDDVLGFVSHDIRSPQASLISLVELRRAGHLDVDEATLLGHIEDLARRSLALADEFLQVARAEAKSLALEDVNPVALLADALREIAPQAQRRNVRLAQTGLDGAPSLRIERALVLRALANLLSNAVKFSPEGSRVEASLALRDNRCVFSIADEGPGIANEDLALLFQRYQRIESNNMLRIQPGVGLGLVFVDAVARRHGGRVIVASVVGEGSRFVLELPYAG